MSPPAIAWSTLTLCGVVMPWKGLTVTAGKGGHESNCLLRGTMILSPNLPVWAGSLELREREEDRNVWEVNFCLLAHMSSATVREG